MHGSSVDFPPHFHILKVNILRSFWVIKLISCNTSFGKPREVKKSTEAYRMIQIDQKTGSKKSHFGNEESKQKQNENQGTVWDP